MMKRLFTLLPLAGLVVLAACRKDPAAPDPVTPDPPENLTPVTVPVESVTLDAAALLLGEGETAVLRATVLPADASAPEVSWSSGDPAVASVDADGKVTALSTGETVVTATADGKTADCTVTVVTAPNVILYRTLDGKVLQPNSVKALGGALVSNTYEDGRGRIECPGPLTTVGKEAFLNCNLLTRIELPLRVTVIGTGAFRNCSLLSEISIPEGVVSLEDDAFYLCSSLQSITLPESLAQVGIGVFSRCSSLRRFDSALAGEDGRTLLLDGQVVAFAPDGLTEYTLPDTVTGIAPSAFKYCGVLRSVTLPASVAEIGTYAFLNCSDLRSLTVLADTPPVLADKNAFESVSALFKIYVPAASVDAYKSASGWSSYRSVILPL